MRAGDLRERVEIHRATTAIGSLGEPSLQWSLVGTLWAAVIPLKAWEIYRRGSAVSTSAVRVLFRGFVDVRESDRLKWRDRTYEIYSINWSAKRDFVEVLAIWTI